MFTTWRTRTIVIFFLFTWMHLKKETKKNKFEVARDNILSPFSPVSLHVGETLLWLVWPDSFGFWLVLGRTQLFLNLNVEDSLHYLILHLVIPSVLVNPFFNMLVLVPFVQVNSFVIVIFLQVNMLVLVLFVQVHPLVTEMSVQVKLSVLVVLVQVDHLW